MNLRKKDIMKSGKYIGLIIFTSLLIFPSIINILNLNFKSSTLSQNFNDENNRYNYANYENDMSSPNSPYAQMQYVPNQTHLYPYIWQNFNLTGDTNASIAILSSGIDVSHIKFGNSPYGDKNFSKQIIGWNDFTPDNNLTPSDPNGLGTFLAGVIAAQNGTEIPNDSLGRISATINRNYYHPNIFEQWMIRQFYTIKIASFNIEHPNTNISINGTFYEHQSNYLKSQDQNTFIIYYNGSIVAETPKISEGNYTNIDYNVTTNTGIYDIGFKYFLDFSNPANFSLNTMLNFTIEEGIPSVSNLTGLTPDTKIIALKVIDNELKGDISQLINALNWINANAEDYHIVAVTISLGNYFGIGALNNAIDSLIQNGIMVFIAAGDNGIEQDALYSIAENKKAIVVGSVNENNQLTYYSSYGKSIGNEISKPDILTPGGSLIAGTRNIISLDSNTNDLNGNMADIVPNDASFGASTSISASIAAAYYNLMIEALGGYENWTSIKSESMALKLKALLLMTASETNLVREDNPYTDVNESNAPFSPVLNRGGKDLNEGYGVANIDAAIDALNKSINIGTVYSDELISSNKDPFGKHVFARKVILEQNKSYIFNLITTDPQSSTDFDLYLYNSTPNSYGEPILLKSSTNLANQNESFIFGSTTPTSEYIVVVKCIDGGAANFSLKISEMSNSYAPQLSDIYINGTQGYNDTLDIFEFSINFTDLDNTPPLLIYLHIDDPSFPENITLAKKYENDNNYSDGCIFFANIRIYNAGTYNVSFWAFDGQNFVSYPKGSFIAIEVKPLANDAVADYEFDFINITNWKFDTWWGIYSQNSSEDDRGSEYGAIWPMLYFGNPLSIIGAEYNYSNIPDSGTFYVYSPQIFVDSGNSPILYLGYRVSVNVNDIFTIEVRANRTGSWTTLDSYTNAEFDWTFKKFDLSSYSNNYIQIRFGATIDNIEETSKNKGFMIGTFKLLNNPLQDNYNPKLANLTVSPTIGVKYRTFRYSFYFGDNDSLPPELVYIELDGKNRSMFNIYGDFNASYTLNGSDLVEGGILYVYDICLGDVSSSSFKIYVKSQQKWYSTSVHLGPIILVLGNGNYPFIDDGTKMNPYGNPIPNPKTAWLESTNSVHFIENQNAWYFGQYDDMGYGLNWDVNLASSLIYIPTEEEEEYSIVLTFDHKLIFDPTFPLLANESATIYISDNQGSSWQILDQFTSGTDITEYTHQKYNLNNYRGKNILIRFNFKSDQYLFGSAVGSGWYIKNISVNYDYEEDRVPPTIQINNLEDNQIISGIFKLNFTVFDNGSGIDYKKISVYLGFKKLSGINIQGNIASVDIDTTQFENGEHTISIFVYDIDGNQAFTSVEIQINNVISRSTLFLWIILGCGIATGIALISYYYYKRWEEEKQIAKRLFDSMVYDKETEDLELGKIQRREQLTKKQRKAIRENERKLYELKIREEAEKATPESEAAKPFTLFCKSCKKWYQSWDFEWICPECKTDTLYVAYQCKLCNKWYFKDEPGIYYCKKRKCKIRLLK
ncbi:MAG: hypothetical protein ACTSRZ_06870 [Promethearchaeota archaeon]